ncbi:MAG TPA: PKD domain-containing protein, partial [Gemmataceae bacterium]|nr:PKD domain-containing protein [Gemmataceae bacterium]
LTVAGGSTLAIAAGDSLSVNGNASFQNSLASFTATPFSNTIGTLNATGTVALNNATLQILDNVNFLPSLFFPPLTIVHGASLTGTFNGLANGDIFVSTRTHSSYRINYSATSATLTRVNGPAFQNRAITPQIEEGGTATLTGHITTILPTDTFFLEVNWGDGGRTRTFKFEPDDPRDVVLHHRYRDDGVYSVSLLWRDQRGAFNTDTLTVGVNNVAPVVDAGGDAFFHGGILTRQVTFTDPGRDRWTATVDYGDGSGPQVIDLHGHKRFLLRHRYTHRGTFTVTVTVTDDDGGVGTASFRARV